MQVSYSANEKSLALQVTTVGLDLAKTNFHVHGIKDDGKVAFNRPPVTVSGIGVLSESWAVPCGHRSLRIEPPSIAGTIGIWLAAPKIEVLGRRGSGTASLSRFVRRSRTWP